MTNAVLHPSPNNLLSILAFGALTLAECQSPAGTISGPLRDELHQIANRASSPAFMDTSPTPGLQESGRREDDVSAAPVALSVASALGSAVMAGTVAPEPQVQVPSLWVLYLAKLDRHQRTFTPADVARPLGVLPATVRGTMRELWPNRCGHYRLDYGEAALVLFVHCDTRRRASDAYPLWVEMMERREIAPSFPHAEADERLLKARDWALIEVARREEIDKAAADAHERSLARRRNNRRPRN